MQKEGDHLVDQGVDVRMGSEWKLRRFGESRLDPVGSR
jgi:hypothetical protein